MADISRLRWLCRRGMKELDLVLNGYLDGYYASASSVEQQYFRNLLDLSDPDLYRLLLGRDQSADPELRRFAQLLRRLSARH